MSERISYMCDVMTKFLSWHEGENYNLKSKYNQSVSYCELLKISVTNRIPFVLRRQRYTYIIFKASLPYRLSCLLDYGFCLCKRIWPSFSPWQLCIDGDFFSHLFLSTFLFLIFFLFCFACVCLSLRQEKMRNDMRADPTYFVHILSINWLLCESFWNV